MNSSNTVWIPVWQLTSNAWEVIEVYSQDDSKAKMDACVGIRL